MTNENKDYVSIATASKAINYGYSDRQINQLCETGKIKSISKEKSGCGKKLVYLNDVIQYYHAHPKERYDTVWDAIKPIKGEKFYIIYGYDNKYLISNKYRVINATDGSIVNAQPHQDIKGNLTGYYTVTLMKLGKPKTVYLHRLIGITQCDNALGKTDLHHIRPVNINNMKLSDHRANNLLYVWKWQHDKLHEYLRNNEMDAYLEMIKKIKEENKQKIYKIPHPEYTNDDNFNYWLYLNKAGHYEYKKDGNITPCNIIKEAAEVIK